MSEQTSAKFELMRDQVNMDIAAIERAIQALDTVWLDNPNPDNAILQSIRLLGGELAWMKRKLTEIDYQISKQ